MQARLPTSFHRIAPVGGDLAGGIAYALDEGEPLSDASGGADAWVCPLQRPVSDA